MSDRHEDPESRRDHRAADQRQGAADQRQGAAHQRQGAAHQRRCAADTLANLLRDADPAGNEAGIAPAELAAMRRTLIAAADTVASSPRWSLGGPWRRAALPVAAAVGALALALWLLAPIGPLQVFPAPDARQARSPGAALDAVTEVPGARPSGPARESSPAPSVAPVPETTVAPSTVGAVDSSPPAIASVPVRPSATPTAAGMAEPSVAATAAATPAATTEAPAGVAATDAPTADRKARTLQFTAPRGTRIIWTLDPEYVSPTAAPSTRQE